MIDFESLLYKTVPLGWRTISSSTGYDNIDSNPYSPRRGELPYAHKRRTSVYLLATTTTTTDKNNNNNKEEDYALVLKRHRYRSYGCTNPQFTSINCTTTRNNRAHVLQTADEQHLADALFSMLLSRLKSRSISPHFVLLVQVFQLPCHGNNQNDSIELIYENILPRSIQPQNIATILPRRSVKSLHRTPGMNYSLLCFKHHLLELAQFLKLDPAASNLDFLLLIVRCLDELFIQGLGALACLFETYRMILYDVLERNLMIVPLYSPALTKNTQFEFLTEYEEWGYTNSTTTNEIIFLPCGVPYFLLVFIDPEYAVCNPDYQKQNVPSVTQTWSMRHDPRITGHGDPQSGFLPGYDVQTFCIALFRTIYDIFPEKDDSVIRNFLIEKSMVGRFIASHPEWFVLDREETLATLFCQKNGTSAAVTTTNTEDVLLLPSITTEENNKIKWWLTGHPLLPDIMTQSAHDVLFSLSSTSSMELSKKSTRRLLLHAGDSFS